MARALLPARSLGVTRCSCCQTPQGPFVRDRDLPGRPVCGLPPRDRRYYHGDPELEARGRIQDCLARRQALEAARTLGAAAAAS